MLIIGATGIPRLNFATPTANGPGLTIDTDHTVPLTPVFEGTPLRDVLERRYSSGIAAARKLKLAAFNDEADPATEILRAIDPVLPGNVQQRVGAPLSRIRRGHCGLEYAAIPFSVDGPAEGLTWIPTGLQDNTPPEKIGFKGEIKIGTFRRSTVYVVFAEETLSKERIVNGTDRALEYLDRNLNALRVECDAWREETAPRILDAVKTRRDQLANLPPFWR